ncbi:hypothetical protein GCM10010844_35950 [Deinococcus radiotolerans]|uniref:Secreted protein n=1 Tax=Deinococcus radiotolerans TaxID=1309407 RepID=A0ABQ2FPI1_9DEIO|nr:hypothetical protein GCM10010844_35950 [Deinococcus radiotolerans]
MTLTPCFGVLLTRASTLAPAAALVASAVGRLAPLPACLAGFFTGELVGVPTFVCGAAAFAGFFLRELVGAPALLGGPAAFRSDFALTFRVHTSEPATLIAASVPVVSTVSIVALRDFSPSSGASPVNVSAALAEPFHSAARAEVGRVNAVTSAHAPVRNDARIG